MGRSIFTLGHSTRSVEDFISLLGSNGITLTVDIRTVPRSRHNPHFNRESLPETLDKAGIGYRHMSGLGGLRHPRPDSINTAWRNTSFRGFADYMQTPEFAGNIDELIGLVESNTICLFCAEAVPWRCHRSLIADALLVRGISVEHIISATSSKMHQLTPWAKVEGTRVWYPAVDTL